MYGNSCQFHFLQEEDCSVSEDVDDDYQTYYSFNDDDLDGGGISSSMAGGHSNLGGSGRLFNNNDDPEYFAYECLTVSDVEKTLNEKVAEVCNVCKVINN